MTELGLYVKNERTPLETLNPKGLESSLEILSTLQCAVRLRATTTRHARRLCQQRVERMLDPSSCALVQSQRIFVKYENRRRRHSLDPFTAR